MRTRAVGALERLKAGRLTEGEAAELAAAVLSNPPPEFLAAQRLVAALGTKAIGVAAVQLLELLAVSPAAELARERGGWS